MVIAKILASDELDNTLEAIMSMQKDFGPVKFEDMHIKNSEYQAKRLELYAQLGDKILQAIEDELERQDTWLPRNLDG